MAGPLLVLAYRSIPNQDKDSPQTNCILRILDMAGSALPTRLLAYLGRRRLLPPGLICGCKTRLDQPTTQCSMFRRHCTRVALCVPFLVNSINWTRIQ